MLPDRIRERTVDYAPGGDRFDRQLIRSIAGLTPGRLNDAKLDQRIVAAAKRVQERTGMRLFPGTFEAEFRYVQLLRNGNYKLRPIVLPGTFANMTAVRLGTLDITADVTDRSSDSRGSLRLWTPEMEGGWLARYDGAPMGSARSIFVDFTAGTQVPLDYQQLVGTTLRWQYDGREEDKKLLDEEYPRMAVMDES